MTRSPTAPAQAMDASGVPPRLAPKLRMTEYGQEKLCTRCNEWWPADEEFFAPNAQGSGQLFHYCRACQVEWQRGQRVKKRAAMARAMERTA